MWNKRRTGLWKEEKISHPCQQSDINYQFVAQSLFLRPITYANLCFPHSLPQQALVGQGLLIIEGSRSHSETLNRKDSSGRVISPTQKPLPEHTHSTHKRQASMLAVGSEPVIPACEWLQTHALDRTVTGIALIRYLLH